MIQTHRFEDPIMAMQTDSDTQDDTTWVVLLIVFGLMGLGGPLLFILLFWLL